MRRRFSELSKRLFGRERLQRRSNKHGSISRHAAFARQLRCEPLEDRRMLSGLTLITHGWHSGVDGWVDHMANEIRSRVPDVPNAGHQTAEYTLEIQGSSLENITGFFLSHEVSAGSPGSALEAATGEVIIKLDWSAFDTQQDSASYVGEYVAKILLNNFEDTEDYDFLSGSIHLIGHSRGASLNTTIAERLSERGVWIDQFTTLDPHPVEWLLGTNDDPMNIWENVRFADNYWRTDGPIPADHLADFDGETVAGSFDLQLSEWALTGEGYINEHSDTHLWYHGTIDTTGPINDGTKSVSADAGWYDGDMGPRAQIGYRYSRIVGGDRTGDADVGIANSGNRVVSAQFGTQWANLESPLVHSGSSTVDQGTDIRIEYRYQATAANCNITFGYDSDRNPYNGATDVETIYKSLTSSGDGFDNGSPDFHYLDTTSVSSGTHYLYAKITSAGGHTRYAYTADQVTIVGVGNHAPNTPGRDWPSHLATGVSLTPTLQSSPFDDPDAGDTHQRSHWVVSTDDEFANVVWENDVDTDSNKTTDQIPPGILLPNTRYYWAVRHMDNHEAWSIWQDFPLTQWFTTGVGNHAPTAVNDFAGTLKTNTVDINLIANDTDPDNTDTLFISGIDVTGTHGWITENGNGTVTYDPSGWPEAQALVAGESLQTTFTYTVSDGHGGSDTATVTVTVNGVSTGDIQLPTADLSDPVNGTVIQESVLNARGYLDITFTDTGGSGLNLTTITDSGKEFTLSGIAANEVTINDVPVWISGTSYRYNFTGTFGEGLVTINFTSGTWADLAGNTNLGEAESFTIEIDRVSTIAVTPEASEDWIDFNFVWGGENWDYTFELWNAGYGTPEFTITPRYWSPEPTSTNPPFVTCTPTTGTLTSDPQLVTLHYNYMGLKRGTNNAVFDIEVPGSSNSYIAIGTRVFVYAMPNTTALNDHFTVAENSDANIIDVLANDVGPVGFTLSVTAVTSAQHGTAQIIDGDVVYTPTLEYHGPDNFTYTIDDGHHGTSSATVNVNVLARQISTISAVIVTESTTPDSNGELNTPPAGADWIDEWASFYVEVWVSTPDTDDVGVALAQVDLKYDTDYFTATGIEYGPGFTEDQTGTINDVTGVVDDLGASTLRTDVGDDKYALLARVCFEPTADDVGVPFYIEDVYVAAVETGIVLESPQVNLAGAVSSEVQLGDTPDTELRAVPYDLDNSGRIDLGDLAFFASVYREKPGITTENPYAYASDYDRSGSVDLGDLAFFAANYRLSRPNNSIAYPVGFSQTSSAAPKTALSMAETPVETAPEQSAEPMAEQPTEQTNETITETPAYELAKKTPTLLPVDANRDGRGDDDDAAILAQHWMMTVEDMDDDDNAHDEVFAEIGATDDALGLYDE